MTKETKGKINSNLKELKKWFDSVYRGKPVELRLDDEDFYVLMFKSYDELLKHVRN